MADLNRYLRRFWRLVAPPGRPGPVAVPVDRAASVADELGVVFERIDAAEEEADRIREAGHERARRYLEHADERVRRILADARAAADQARADAQAHHRQDLRAENEAALAAAREEASAIKARSGDNLETLTQHILGRVGWPE
ncbi:MAG TPA: hypothetical protein VE175_04290, partial [Woeseiaceae bacterium]|nr:hypothetical protein [Woeseiaceae bacterium]